MPSVYITWWCLASFLSWIEGSSDEVVGNKPHQRWLPSLSHQLSLLSLKTCNTLTPNFWTLPIVPNAQLPLPYGVLVNAIKGSCHIRSLNSSIELKKRTWNTRCFFYFSTQYYSKSIKKKQKLLLNNYAAIKLSKFIVIFLNTL